MNDLKLDLNPEQLRAVEHPHGPLLIIAGAGTGKTTVITERIKWLIQNRGHQPSEILALTFTEKAAEEMEERVDIALPMGFVQTWICTFHSFCERVLRREAIHLGLSPNFRILTEAESYFFVKKHIFDFELDYYRPQNNPTKFIAALITHFNRLRDENISWQDYEQFIKNHPTPEEQPQQDELVMAYKKYQSLKKENNVMDFADLLFYTLQLFSSRPAVLDKYRQKFRQILVDEFQDTNYIQNQIALQLAGDDRNITAVCDDDQSIYRWRGAALYNVLDFKKHFPGTEVVSLNRNYRSPQPILDHAYRLIQNNDPDRLEVREKINKKLVSEIEAPLSNSPLRLIWVEKVEDEAESIGEQIRLAKEKHPQLELRDFAILVRSNKQAIPFIKALSRLNIPYQFLRPGQLYFQPRIKDLIAYLKVLVDPFDGPSFYRVLTIDYFQLDPRDIVFIVGLAKRNNLTYLEIFERIKDFSQVSPKTQRQVKRLVEQIHRHQKLVPRHSPGQILYAFLEDNELLEYYSEPQSAQHQREINNIARFFDQLMNFETQYPDSNLYDFIEYLDFVMEEGESPLAAEIDWLENNAVNILTFHSAKGLEFPVVFMAGLVNDRFPTRRRSDPIPLVEELIKEPSPQKDPHIAEERRLFYVGMTRAKQLLYLTGSKFYHNHKRPKKLSPFVREALGEDLQNYQIAPPSQPSLSLANWQISPDNQVQPIIEEKKLSSETISYSQIDTFTICPLQYKYAHLLRIPAPPNPSLSFGTSIHETLAEVYRYHAAGKEVSWELIEKTFHQHWKRQGYTSPDHEEELRQEGLRLLQDYYQNHHSPDLSIIKVEHPFTLKVGPAKIRGKIDRIDQLDNERIEIIDYKTGRSKTQREVDKNLQLSVYSLAVASPQVLNVPPEKQVLTLHFLSSGERISTTRDADDHRITQKKIGQIFQDIKKSNFEPQVGYLCQYCPYQILCPAYQGKI